MIPFLLFFISFLSVGYTQPFPSDFVRGSPPDPASTSVPPTCQAALTQCLDRLDNGKVCEILPIPVRSLLPQIPEEGFMLQRLRRDVWLYNDGNYNSIVIATSKRLVLIDFADSFSSNTNNGTRTRLTDAVDRVLGNRSPKRVDMIYSHAHFDHIGAAQRFFTYAKARFPDARFVIWGTEEVKNLIAASRTNRAVKPTVLIKHPGAVLRVRKSLHINMSILGGHSQEDLMINIPRVRKQPSILFVVDMVFPRWVMPFNLAITQDVRALIRSHKMILDEEFDVLVGGHLQVGFREDVLTNLEYLRDLLRITKEAPASVSRLTFFQAGVTRADDRREREFGNLWWTIRLARELEIDVCYRRMIEKWGCRLAAVDVHLRGHCLIGLMFQSVDA